MASLQYAYEQQQLDFLHLCSLGDEHRVRDALLTGRVDVNYRHKSNGWTALHWAASRGHYDIILLLIEAGYDLNAEDGKHRVPYDVCPEDKKDIRSILELGEDRENMVQIVSGNASRRSSDASDQASPGFIPNYVRHPPFPYAMKNSFDSFSSPPATSGTNGSGSPGPLNSPTYSYGRRDSFNKTRFLLVRTSVGKGKETYKRVTLPGGSDVERLRITIEKACKGRQVDMIFTLPDNDLVESIEQIHQFKDCQKIDVVFKDDARESTPAVTGDTIKMSEGREVSPKELVVEHEYGQEDIEIPKNEEERDEKEEEPRAATPAEDLSRFVKEPSPPISLAATDLDSNNGTEEGNGDGHDEPKLIPLATRQSLDSDPGDFEKVDKEEAKLPDTSPAVAGIAAAVPYISDQVKKEHKEATVLEQDQEPSFVPPPSAHQAPSSKATVVEESKQVPEDRESSDLATWIHNNPDIVRNVATVAAVAGVAGIGYYVYIKKFK
uniref:ANK_REP_REGION domain-containing protein n=1 Tax=Caenorhabditis tropicalis TaxID=1561998 RepID=A0A1I7UBX3_9PELO